ncbi:MAG: DUF4132 domain-containing protein [Sandaracinus sp.]|nr:DUF4132 domain-containing protein [Sandaracinus sp.]
MRSLAAQQSRDDLVDRAMPRGDDDASRQSVTARLENAMCTARRWTPESFRELVLAHPVAAKVASNVLFACFVDDEVHPFRVVDGAPVGRDGSAFELRGGVGIPHPVELAPEVIDAWIDELAEPPFEQLDRPATANASEVLDRALPAAPIVAGELPLRRARETRLRRGGARGRGIGVRRSEALRRGVDHSHHPQRVLGGKPPPRRRQHARRRRGVDRRRGASAGRVVERGAASRATSPADARLIEDHERTTALLRGGGARFREVSGAQLCGFTGASTSSSSPLSYMSRTMSHPPTN